MLHERPTRPFVTYYDEARGERTELSARSAANWVAKTASLLTDELGLGVGDVAYAGLPAHWISVPILLGGWTAGLDLHDDPDGADVAFVASDNVVAASDTFAIALPDAAVGFRGAPPSGTVDYVLTVRPHADVWDAVTRPAGPADPGLNGRPRHEVVTQAADRAAELGLTAGARVLSTRSWRSAEDWIDTVLAPLVVGGSLVLVRGADEDTVARRAAQERVTQIV